MHKSIATIDSPEFINLQTVDINPLMSSCDIKVLYVGQNRNHSYITKEVATEMSKTLRGAPIVGYYKSDKQDYGDHGQRMTLDDEGIKFECLTKPYGFVAPDAKVWFQKFEDYDDFGNTVVREYLMTTGYLWTGQFEEVQSVIDDGKPQSMELDNDTLEGKWSTDTNSGIDFFIINDAIFSKLCILGDDVEPCFEGASITAPTISQQFSLDDNFKNTLFSMIEDLKNIALQKGGQHMEKTESSVVENATIENSTFAKEDPSIKTPETSFKKDDKKKDEKPKSEDKPTDNLDKESEDEKEEKSTEKPEEEKDTEKSDDPGSDDKDEEDKKKKKPITKHILESKEYTDLNNKYTALQTDFNALQAKCNELTKFKLKIEDAKKDELIKSFYMLSEEDKKDVIENKSKYSYDDIEAKLSILCVRKKVNFDLENNSKNDNKIEESPAVTFNLEETESSVPAWVSALKNARNNNN